ncbi:MAG TPA: AraC family transcriptional regulator [Polyangia bacterium]|nr:AraC family transcriptional regulator [Polyangia bacterium]
MTSHLPRGRFLGRTLKRRKLDELVIIDSRHAAGTRLPRHAHEHPYFCVNYGGSYAEKYGRRRRHCRPGMLVFHPAGEYHSEDHESDVGTLNVEVSGSWLRRIAELHAPLDQPAQFAGDEIAALGLQLVQELRRRDGDSTLAVESLTWEILAASADNRRRFLDAHPPRWLRDARDLVDARLDEAPSLRAIAAEANVHPVYFAAMFRRFVGCSLGEYVRRRRFDRARRRLASANVSLTQVALEAGFADQSHFSRTFKRLAGMTPMEYRTFLAFKTRR